MGVAAAGEGGASVYNDKPKSNAHLHRDCFPNSAVVPGVEREGSSCFGSDYLFNTPEGFVESFKWVRYPRYPC